MRCGRRFRRLLGVRGTGRIAPRNERAGTAREPACERANPERNGHSADEATGSRPTERRRARIDGTANPHRCKSAPRGASRTVARQGCGRSAECRDEQKGAYSSPAEPFYCGGSPAATPTCKNVHRSGYAAPSPRSLRLRAAKPRERPVGPSIPRCSRGHEKHPLVRVARKSRSDFRHHETASWRGEAAPTVRGA